MTTGKTLITCPGGCGTTDACGCYAEGYASGKDKAHFEIRSIVVDHDWAICGCEACQTVLALLDRTGAEILVNPWTPAQWRLPTGPTRED